MEGHLAQLGYREEDLGPVSKVMCQTLLSPHRPTLPEKWMGVGGKLVQQEKGRE